VHSTRSIVILPAVADIIPGRVTDPEPADGSVTVRHPAGGHAEHLIDLVTWPGPLDEHLIDQVTGSVRLLRPAGRQAPEAGLGVEDGQYVVPFPRRQRTGEPLADA
jgi:hypothetical protein